MSLKNIPISTVYYNVIKLYNISNYNLKCSIINLCNIPLTFLNVLMKLMTSEKYNYYL